MKTISANNWTEQAHDIARNIISEFDIKRSAHDFFSFGFKKIETDRGASRYRGDLMIEAFYPKAFNFDFEIRSQMINC